MGKIYTTTSKQKMVLQLTRRISSLTIQTTNVQAQNAPQTQELANLAQALADARYELEVTNGAG